MALICQSCGREFPDFPDDAVEDDRLDEVVMHKFDPDGIAVSQTDYYCDLECAAEALEGGDV
ncbi:hypothetical protein J2752_000491 [Halarchaeum rubridurum]|uniref:MYM-type Zinc finger with FCS sequence motif-containing protein n=1 Tax=Halarchaeum rubridurum TaxID=489911 RepID=A0A830FNA6_9EURY|nr:hypothetical protein [Halarchaeum rubridurum]MBP1953610.1 hypothetical protein [Halarchaeum rubridurum]GGM63931.1 hypothetical protein GCM10009017_12530 [Halarchaeum rubridurum]